MVLTALFVRLHKTSPCTRHESPFFRSIGLGLLLLCPSLLTACGAGGDTQNDNFVAAEGNQTVSLAWNGVSDPSITGYFVYYGRQSTNLFGSCAYSGRIFTSSTSATVTGLAPDTLYYFAVSAYNGLESACSAEVSTVTQSV